MVYRHHPGSVPAEQRKKVDSAGNPAMRRCLKQGFYFNPLTQLQTWESSREKERKRGNGMSQDSLGGLYSGERGVGSGPRGNPRPPPPMAPGP
jgi:hypothetical protein